MSRLTPAAGRRSRRRSWFTRIGLATTAAALAVVGVPVLPSESGGAAASAGLADDFTGETVLEGLDRPTAVSFAPNGHVFVAEKSGLIKGFDSLADPSPTVVADLRTEVHNYGDRGLLGLAVDPQFPTRPYVYPLYTYDALPGGAAPQWGSPAPGATSDPCATPLVGCVVQGRLSQLTVDVTTLAAASEDVLVEGWCQQYPSHSIGTVAFGNDGMLYASAGEGASFSHIDWGQTGNPCADPPGPAGSDLSPPDARGGALRAQSPTRPDGEPVTLSGSLIRVDPDTGTGAAGNPFVTSADANAQRVVAYGMRNPFRFAPRPDTDEIWIGDVGASTWEEINTVTVGDGTAENFGWPCFEGTGHMPGFDAADLDQCETLYAEGGVTPPYLQYEHSGGVLPGDDCGGGSSAISGVAFAASAQYPTDLNGALFFSDSVRGCIWAMNPGDDGQPDPDNLTPIASGLSTPVQLSTGPDGSVYWVDMYGGKVNHLVYTGGNHPPTAQASAAPVSGELPLTVEFDGSASTDPDPGDTLTYTWDLDGDGGYDDATGATTSRTYTEPGTVTVGLRVTDGRGGTSTDTVTISPGQVSTPPVPVIDAPSGDVQWTVGEPVTFQGHATDGEDGELPPAALDWDLTLQHCPDGCHTHPLQSFADTATGSFVAPDHEYPSNLTLTLTATDSSGQQASTSVDLHPKTVELTFVSDPAGLELGVFDQTEPTPFRRTVIVGSANSVSAPGSQSLGGVTYDFAGWSDGGAATHTLIAPEAPTTYTATFTPSQAGGTTQAPPPEQSAGVTSTPTAPPAASPGPVNAQPAGNDSGSDDSAADLAETGVRGVVPLLAWGAALTVGGTVLVLAPRWLRARPRRHRL